MLLEYATIGLGLLVGGVVGVIMFALSYILILRNYDIEKLTPYECGFTTFRDSRDLFDVRFYLVAILFLIFDLEIVYLFPWCLAFYAMSLFGIISMIVFLIILTVGFVYEWMKGALDW